MDTHGSCVHHKQLKLISILLCDGWFWGVIMQNIFVDVNRVIFVFAKCCFENVNQQRNYHMRTPQCLANSEISSYQGIGVNIKKMSQINIRKHYLCLFRWKNMPMSSWWLLIIIQETLITIQNIWIYENMYPFHHSWYVLFHSLPFDNNDIKFIISSN